MTTNVLRSPAAPYMGRPANRVLVLATFPLVALPLAAYLLLGYRRIGDAVFANPIVQGYTVCLGITHFFLTFTVYLSSANLRHFLSSSRNVFAFFVAPLVPMAGVAGWYGFAMNEQFAFANGALLVAIRGLDFHHLCRQAFGVLQLVKGPGMRTLPRWTRTAENLFFLALAIQMFLTFKTGYRFDPSYPLTWVMCAVSGSLFVAMLAGYAIALRAGADRKQTAQALAYIAVQTGSCLLAIYRTGLYVTSLAVHYVEYHVIMHPRVFRSPIGERDGVLRVVRKAPIVLYAVLFALGALWWIFQQRAATAVGGTRVLVHVFDGIFVFHYIIEMSIWKFSDPYFRKSLGPLYMP